MNNEKLLRELKIAPENKEKIQQIQEYMKDNRIQELFNVININQTLLGNPY